MRRPWLLVLLGCCRSPVPAVPPPTVVTAPRPADQPHPTCDAEALHWQVGGMALTVDEGGHRLWRGDCAHGQIIAAYPDAWFLKPLVATDGGLLYSRADGVWEVELATATSHLMYATPHGIDPDCLQMPMSDPDRPVGTLSDQLDDVADGGAILVLLRRGHGCHYPAAWRVRVSGAAEHPARPIYDLAADGNTIYFVDGEGVWSTVDGKRLVKIPTKPIRIPARVVVRGGDLLVRSGVGEIAEGTRGPDLPGKLWRSRDHGKHWRALAVKDGPELIAWVRAGATLDELELGGGDETSWRTTDGGKHWSTSAGHPDARTVKLTTVAGDFEATEDGLYVTRAGVRTRVTAELARPLAADRF